MFKKLLVLLFAISVLAGCARVELASHIAKNAFPPPTPPTKGTFKVGNPYKIENRWYYPQEDYDLIETGIASWYGPGFHGKQTANGEIFNKHELTAAHRTLQMPSLVRVTNLDNGKSLIVRINDRGPYKKGRIIDLSEKAAELLAFKDNGTAKVKIQVLRNESQKVAEAAKNGKSTRGYELALNGKNGLNEASYEIANLTKPPPTEGYKATVEPVSRESLASPNLSQKSSLKLAGNRSGILYPEQVVTQYPVSQSKIFIQAGAFSTEENAVRLSSKLKKFHQASISPSIINGSQLYRVRLGPVYDVIEADQLVNLLVRNGYEDTIIVVD